MLPTLAVRARRVFCSKYPLLIGLMDLGLDSGLMDPVLDLGLMDLDLDLGLMDSDMASGPVSVLGKRVSDA